MILATNQPYFAPFPGFFHKMAMSEVFVILDEVQFPRGTTWLTRNRFKNDQGTLWITVPVWKKGLGLQTINEVRICHEGRWAKKHLASLKTAYLRAPYFDEHLGFLEELFSGKFEKVIDLTMATIQHIIKTLSVNRKPLLLSELGVPGSGSERLVKICKKLGASRYLAQTAAKKYLDENLFHDAGIEVTYVYPPSPVYPQLWGDFIGNLSSFDLIFNCGPKSLDILMKAKCPES